MSTAARSASAPVQTVAILGGGTAGWMSAAALSRSFGDRLRIELVESDEIGIIGVGEATVPHLSAFNALLQIDEAEFVRQTRGTFKLGIQFKDWHHLGDSYIHGFGTIGRDVGPVAFHQYWLRARALGRAKDIGHYSLNTVAAPQGRFMPSPRDAPANSPLAEIAYAYHFDAGLYAAYLRGYAEARGVRRTEGKVVSVTRDPENGFVRAIALQNGTSISADLFLDCSGFRGLLISGELEVGFEDWSHWLPCDRAVAVACEKVGPPTPYTRSTALEAGWQWRIPLQHRTGNGYVYCSRMVSDDAAAARLLGGLDGKPLAEPRQLRFTAGKRRQLWSHNVVAIGLAGGFLEPLESTAIFLIQSGLFRLIQLLPRCDMAQTLRDTYNEQAQFEYERIRDFLILHYCATERDDSELWRYTRAMKIPDSLEAYIQLFADSGRFFRAGTEMFGLTSWVQVMLGQGIVPRNYHPAVDWVQEKDVLGLVDHAEQIIATNVAAMPKHDEFIARYCAAPGT